MTSILRQFARRLWPRAFYRKPQHARIGGFARVWMTRCGYHRRHGPAIEYNDGTKSWYYDGVHYLYEDSFGELRINEVFGR
jgi:hypothetical protein